MRADFELHIAYFLILISDALSQNLENCYLPNFPLINGLPNIQQHLY